MRLTQTPLELISLLLALILPTNAAPTPRELLEKLGFGYMDNAQLNARDVSCGSDNQYTCTGGEACYTNAQQIAYCSIPSNVESTTGAYGVYTTTYTETDLVLRTSTYTSWQATTSAYTPAPTGGTAVCDTSQQQTSCGPICCASYQYCMVSGQCAAISSSGLFATTTSTYSAPLRPTSGTGTTQTKTQSVTTTQSFIPPATASGSSIPITESSTSHGLSGGAIAGIVIGTIAGIILLLLICFCCVVKAGFNGLRDLLGFGSRKRRSSERVEVVEERYSRHGSAAAPRRDAHTGWFGAGGRPARVDSARKKKSSGFGGLGAVGAGLIGLAAILGLKRRHDKKEMAQRSEISSSYYTDSYTGTSASSASSDRRTRDSRHTRGTRR